MGLWPLTHHRFTPGKRLALGKRRQGAGLRFLFLRFLLQRGKEHLLYGFPAGNRHHTAPGRKGHAATFQYRHRILINLFFSNGTQQTHHNQGQDIPFPGGQGGQGITSYLHGGQEGMMVTDLGTIYYTGHIRRPHLHRKGQALNSHFHQSRHRGRRIFGQVIGICTGIGQQLLFVQRLGIV